MSVELSNEYAVEPDKADGVKLATGTSLLAGLGALASASCCALPLSLSMLGLGGAWLANLGALVENRETIATVALAVLAVGWLVALRRHRQTCSKNGICARPGVNWTTFGILGVSTAFVGLAFFYSLWEPTVIRFLWDLKTGA